MTITPVYTKNRTVPHTELAGGRHLRPRARHGEIVNRGAPPARNGTPNTNTKRLRALIVSARDEA